MSRLIHHPVKSLSDEREKAYTDQVIYAKHFNTSKFFSVHFARSSPILSRATYRAGNPQYEPLPDIDANCLTFSW
jgi:hypothetical protein